MGSPVGLLRFVLVISFAVLANGFVCTLRHSSLLNTFSGRSVLPAQKQPRRIAFAATSLRMENLNSLTVKDLRERLSSMGQSPPSKMKKAELIEMLSSISEDTDDGGDPEPTAVADQKEQGGLNIEGLTVPELKQELKLRGLKVGGKKSELQERLSEAIQLEGGSGKADVSVTAAEAAPSEAFTDLDSMVAESTEVFEAFSEAYAQDDAAEEIFPPESTEAVTEFSDTYAEGPEEEAAPAAREAAGAEEGARDVSPAASRGRAGSQGRGRGGVEELTDLDAELAEEWAETTQVFVRGIPFRARPQDLVDLFEARCGIVTRIEGMFFNGRASGRAWITFEDKPSAEAALTLDREEMDGRFIEVYPPWSRPARQALRQVTEGQGMDTGMRGGRDRGRGGYGGNGGGRQGYGRTHTIAPAKCKHLFIGRIPLGAREDDVHEALQGLAGIVDVRLGFKDGEFKGFCHVEFQDDDYAEEALARPIVIMGRQCRSDFAAPRRNDATRTRYR